VTTSPGEWWVSLALVSWLALLIWLTVLWIKQNW